MDKTSEQLELELRDLISQFALREKQIAGQFARLRKDLRSLKTEMRAVFEAMDSEVLESHSTPAVADTGDTGKHEVTTFTDMDPGYGVDIKGQKDETFDTVHVEDSGLASFLSRPVRIQAVEWDTGTSQNIDQTFNPWKLFFENAVIAEKIKYYNNLSCKLHVKFVINGNSFLYGRLLVSYEPMPVLSQLSLGNVLFNDFILRSQRPHIMLNPTTNEGGTLTLPFMYDQNYMNIPSRGWDRMGEITISDLNSLRHAQGDVGQASITVYAWAEDVVLTTPTASAVGVLESQSKRVSKKKSKKQTMTMKSDEYGSGIISKPASAVAAAAGWLKDLPVIGPYARATEMVAGKTGEVAKIFGYARPPSVEGPCTTKLVSASPFANTDRTDTVMKLSLDSKQEVTIDPRVIGADPEDHMGIYDLIQRQSLLTQFNWNFVDGVVGTQLFAANLTPSVSTTNNNGNNLYMTPLAWMSQMFQFWHGTMKFRFQVVASNFHKGRLLITYDPNKSLDVAEEKVYSQVVDISETRDFEIEIGWGQSTPWRNVGTVGQPNGGIFEEFVNSDTNLPYQPSRCNGQLLVTVLNELTSPGDITTAPGVTVNVWVSASDDFKFAVPIADRIADLSVVPLQSQSGPPLDGATDKGLMENKPEETMSMSINEDGNTDKLMEVFIGEHVVSLRDLFRRYCFSTPWEFSGVPDSDSYWFLFSKVFPFYRGRMPSGTNGIYSYIGTNAVFYSVNPVVTCPLTYCAPAFLAWRGGLRKKIVNNTDNYIANAMVSVHRLPFSTEPISTRDDTYPNPIDYVANNPQALKSFNGAELTLTRNTGMIEVEFPYYQSKRFSSPRIFKPQDVDSDSYEYSFNTTYGGNTTDENVFIREYVSTAEDFSLIYFVNVPIMYRYKFVAEQP